MRKAHPPETREQARLLRELGYGWSRIGRELGISGNTVKMWLVPGFREDQYEANRLRKKRYHGTCVDCGGTTSYGKGQGPSVRCQACRVIYVGKHPMWTREKVVAAMQRWAREHGGRPPTATEWVRRGDYWPAATSIYDKTQSRHAPFNSWNEAIAAAGFTPRHTSPGPGGRVWSLDEAARLRKTGLPDTEIGRRLGVSASAIWQGLGPRKEKPYVWPPKAPKRSRDRRIADLQKALAKENP